MIKSIYIKKLEGMYLRLISKHNNSTWAIEEMEWEVFVNHADEFNKLNEIDQWIIRNYMGSLKKLYGGN